MAKEEKELRTLLYIYVYKYFTRVSDGCHDKAGPVRIYIFSWDDKAKRCDSAQT